MYSLGKLTEYSLFDAREVQADYLQHLINAYYYLVEHYSMLWGTPELSAATLIRITIRKSLPSFIG